MSLINDALKKAQRRAEEKTGDAVPVPGSGGRVGRPSPASGSNTLILVGSGALVLVVLSVVITVWLVNRPASPPVAAAPKATPSVAPAPTAAAATPVIVTPSLTPAPAPAIVASQSTPSLAEKPAVAAPPPATTTTTTVATAAPPAVAPPTPAPATTTPSATVPSEPAVTKPAEQVAATPAPPAASAATTPAAPGKPDERISAFVDAIRVAGIRSSGSDSRVLMNDRVYRVNDIVERVLGVRLVKVAADSLTFSDPNGVTYVKKF